MLIDTHAHLSDSAYDEVFIEGFCGVSYKDIIKAMPQDELEKIISVGYDIESSVTSKNIANKNENVYFSCGIHPSEANDFATNAPNYCKVLLDLAKHKKCVAIGEIGLDYHYAGYVKENQRKILIEQMHVVRQADKPVIFHVRDADGDMLDIVKEHLSLLPKRGVMHCFSGSKETALQYIDMGFYISFSGSVTFKNALKFADIIPALPRDRILVETDCPYLAPQAFRGKLNFPKHVKQVAQKISDICNISVAEVEQFTTQNAKNLFGF